MSGACIEPRALNELFPDWKERGVSIWYEDPCILFMHVIGSLNGFHYLIFKFKLSLLFTALCLPYSDQSGPSVCPCVCVRPVRKKLLSPFYST